MMSWPSPHWLPRATTTVPVKQIYLNVLRNATRGVTCSAHLLTCRIFSLSVCIALLSSRRTQEPAADYGIPPLWQLERLSHQTQGPLWCQKTVALFVTGLQGNSAVCTKTAKLVPVITICNNEKWKTSALIFCCFLNIVTFTSLKS